MMPSAPGRIVFLGRITLILVTLCPFTLGQPARCVAEIDADLPWYNSDIRSIARDGTRWDRASDLTPPRPDLSEPTSPKDWEPPDWTRPKPSTRRWPRMPSWLTSGVSFAAKSFLVLLVLVLIVFGTVTLMRRLHVLGSSYVANKNEVGNQVDITKLADLGLNPEANDNLLAQIRDRRATGKLDAAIVLLYGYELLRLDKAQLLRILRGKTNRQYVRELRNSPRLQQLLGDTMFAFEDSFFGGRTISADRLDACLDRLDEFHSLIEASA